MGDLERRKLLAIACPDALLLATVDTYRRVPCPLQLEPVWSIVREGGKSRVELSWRVTVYPEVLELAAEGSGSRGSGGLNQQ